MSEVREKKEGVRQRERERLESWREEREGVMIEERGNEDRVWERGREDREE